MLDGMGMPRWDDDLDIVLQKLQNEEEPWHDLMGFQELLNSAMSDEPEASVFGTTRQILEQEISSCITGVSREWPSPAKTETRSATTEDGVSDTTQELNAMENCTNVALIPQSIPPLLGSPSGVVASQPKKRKRGMAAKNNEEVQSKRMTHIEVERNRRKQMNQHINVLRSLIPGSYIQRGDQASVIGGAIDLVKELEQHLNSLEIQKFTEKSDRDRISDNFTNPQYTPLHSASKCNGRNDSCFEPNCELRAEKKSAEADIDVTVVETHASLKILTKRTPGQLIKTIDALEMLHLTPLHINITTVDHTALYSFNVKIEDKCQRTSAKEIATAVHQMLRIIHRDTISQETNPSI